MSFLHTKMYFYCLLIQKEVKSASIIKAIGTWKGTSKTAGIPLYLRSPQHLDCPMPWRCCKREEQAGRVGWHSPREGIMLSPSHPQMEFGLKKHQCTLVKPIVTLGKKKIPRERLLQTDNRQGGWERYLLLGWVCFGPLKGGFGDSPRWL